MFRITVLSSRDRRHSALAASLFVTAGICLFSRTLCHRNPIHHPLSGQIQRRFRSSFQPLLVMGSAEKLDKEIRIPQEARRILQLLAAEWSDIADTEALQVVRLKGAMTNEVYQIRWPTIPGPGAITSRSRKVLVRIYGTGVEAFFDRENEIRTFEFLSKQGQGPRLLGRFPNGRVEEFIRARTLSAADLRDPGISGIIAAKLKEFHDLDMPGTKTMVLWDRLHNWLNEAKRFASHAEANEFCLNSLNDEISMLQKHLSGSDHQVVGFCHNDLQYGNIMMDEETRTITIIDYEYASYNPVAFDIANHFCEMAADYHTETPHILDFNKYPGVEERQKFLRIYQSSAGNIRDEDVDQLLNEVEKYTLASHLLWGLWGIISEHVNKIDFDYLEYARQRFQQYWGKKSQLL